MEYNLFKLVIMLMALEIYFNCYENTCSTSIKIKAFVGNNKTSISIHINLYINITISIVIKELLEMMG